MDQRLPQIDFTPVVVPITSGIKPLEALRRLRPLGGTALLSSPPGSGPRGRYSFLMADPVVCWKPTWRWLAKARAAGGLPLKRLDLVLRRHFTRPVEGLPPFQGGWVGLCSYELGGLFERLPLAAHDPLKMPAAVFSLHDFVVAWDHAGESAWIISQGLPETHLSRRRERAAIRAEMIARLLESGLADRSQTWTGFQRRPTGMEGSRRWSLAFRPPPDDIRREGRPAGRGLPPLHDVSAQATGWDCGLPLASNFSPDGYRRAVQRCVELIRAGDAFQINLAQQLFLPDRHDGLSLLESVGVRNPAPFSAWFDLGARQVISASPERLFSVRDGWIETCPIKGTRPRGDDPAGDAASARELLASRKDRAENTMIVDLMRNDLSRICTDDSVQVTQWCGLESFATVHHLVSAVRGKLRAGTGFADVLAAVFPGGSVTGAPKIRAMEIITELEQTARGAYCGTAGYIGLDGSADFNILIRTITAGRGWWQLPVGGGVVADSDPDQEYAETWGKAAGMLDAIAALEPVAIA